MNRTNAKQIDLEQNFLIDDFDELPTILQQEILFAYLGEIQDKLDAEKEWHEQSHFLQAHNKISKRIDFPCLYKEDRYDILASLPVMIDKLKDVEQGREHSSIKSSIIQVILANMHLHLA